MIGETMKRVLGTGVAVFGIWPMRASQGLIGDAEAVADEAIIKAPAIRNALTRIYMVGLLFL